MAKTSYGGNLSMGTTTVMLFGGVAGLLTDAFWYSFGLPGGNRRVNGCGILSEGDVIQLGLVGGLTFLGFVMNNKVIPAFTFGTMMGMLIPKLITPYLGLPRYGLFDYDPASGALKPVTRL